MFMITSALLVQVVGYCFGCGTDAPRFHDGCAGLVVLGDETICATMDARVVEVMLLQELLDTTVKPVCTSLRPLNGNFSLSSKH